MSRIKIVAEIGCNHNGDVELAKSLLPDVTKQYEHTMEGVKSLKE